ncbi:MAG: SDR family oxidoreductase [Chloroflexi bacterium]|nr:SDR family oxidoreductase [Chloroflexota bacterium]
MQKIADLFNLSGKAAVVTGGAIGIGQAIALRLAEAGAAVTITDINLDGAKQVVAQIEGAGGKARAIQADASSATDAEKVVHATVEAFGSIDILVNNAGIYPVSPVMKTSEQLLNRVLNLNLKGPFVYSQAAARQMIKAGQGGRIINLASTDGLKPTGFVAHYNASKGGVVMLTKAMALELAPHKILVNAVAPGGILTPGTVNTQQAMQDATGKSIEQLIEQMAPRFPLGRMGDPDDVARAVLFLAGGASDYMTGTIVVVDGGYLLS